MSAYQVRYNRIANRPDGSKYAGMGLKVDIKHADGLDDVAKQIVEHVCLSHDPREIKIIRGRRKLGENHTWNRLSDETIERLNLAIDRSIATHKRRKEKLAI